MEKREVYLDNAATTQPYREVVETVSSMMTSTYGNPSSVHAKGTHAKISIDASKDVVGYAIKAKFPHEQIIFTSGGTESDNLAIIGTALAYKRLYGKNHIITSSIEHHAVLNAFRYLEEQHGFDVTILPVGNYGMVSPSDLFNACTFQTSLVSIMMVNNEIGTIQPIKQLAEIAHKHHAVFHTDAVQAIGWLSIDVDDLDVDMLSMSAHKFHGPKGIGALYVRNKSYLPDAIMFGGHQQWGIRPGTESVYDIAGMSVAINKACNNIEEKVLRTQNIRSTFIKYLLAKVPNIHVNCATSVLSPNIISVAIPGIDAETLIMYLNNHGVCVSAGSACDSRWVNTSHVLNSIGLASELAASTIRISLSEDTKLEDMFYAADIISEAISLL